jgi:hypothetical protein
MDSSVSPKGEIWFLPVCHHISNAANLILFIWMSSTSTPKSNTSDLPHGAVLSTKLFTLYLPDIPRPLHSRLILYADDTARLSQSWRPDIISRKIRAALTILHKYFTKWKLRLNTPKTETILFSKTPPPTPSRTLFKHRTPLCPGPRQSAI